MAIIYSQASVLNFNTFELVSAFDLRILRERYVRERKDGPTAEKLSAENHHKPFYVEARVCAWLGAYSTLRKLADQSRKLETSFWYDKPRSDVYLLEKTIEQWKRIAKKGKQIDADSPLCIAHWKCVCCPITVAGYRDCNFPARNAYFCKPAKAKAKATAEFYQTILEELTV